MKLPIVLFVLASLVDLLITLVLLRHGLAWEANPIAASWIRGQHGLVEYKAATVACTVFCALCLSKYRPKIAANVLIGGVLLTLVIISVGLLTVR